MSKLSIDLVIQPHRGVGNIKFGMQREEVRGVLSKAGGNFTCFMKSTGSQSPTDAFDNLGIHVFYTKAGICEAVELFEPANPKFKNKSLIGEPFSKLKIWFEEINSELEIIDTGLISRTFGISLYAPGGIEKPSEPVASVLTFTKGYYRI